jgi:hypothetical protein
MSGGGGYLPSTTICHHFTWVDYCHHFTWDLVVKWTLSTSQYLIPSISFYGTSNNLACLLLTNKSYQLLLSYYALHPAVVGLVYGSVMLLFVLFGAVLLMQNIFACFR